MIRLLIFDLDGTLADTSKDIADAINHALKPFGQRRYSVEETKAMVGSGISKLLESLTPADPPFPPSVKGRRESAKELVTRRFFEFYSEHLLDNTSAYPYVKETLSSLGDYRKVVLSNKRTAFSREILEGLGLLEYFGAVFGSDSVREKKPSPVPVLDILKEFHVSRDEAIIIGDSNYDVEAGKAAGVRIIGVTYGFRSIEFLKGADIIIESFDELLKVIPRNKKATA